MEADEDSRELGRKAIAKKKPTKKDVVVGVAASGRTPFTVAAIEYARAHGAMTVAVVCNPKSPLGKAAHIAIVAEVGAEVVAGSTRMKAGTAEKMILNMLSTGAMARLGYVYGNLMVNVSPKNSKLAERGVGILKSRRTRAPRRAQTPRRRRRPRSRRAGDGQGWGRPRSGGSCLEEVRWPCPARPSRPRRPIERRLRSFGTRFVGVNKRTPAHNSMSPMSSRSPLRILAAPRLQELYPGSIFQELITTWISS